VSPYDPGQNEISPQRHSSESHKYSNGAGPALSKEVETSNLKRLLRRWPVAAGFAIIFALLGFLSCRFIKTVFESSAEVLIKSPTASPLTSVASEISMMTGMSGLGSSGDIPTDIEQMTSDEALNEVARRSGLNPDPIKFRKLVTITPHKTSGQIVLISVAAPSAKQAQTAVQSLVDVYNQHVENDHTTSTGRMIDTTQTQIADVGAKLRQFENEYAKYSVKVGSLDPESESTQKVTQLYTLRKEVLDSEQDQDVAKLQIGDYKNLVSTLDPSVVPTLSMQQSPLIQADQSKLSDLQTQRTSLAAEYTPEDDEMVKNQKQIDEVRAEILEELQREAKTTSSALTTLDSSKKTQQMSNSTPGYVVSNLTRSTNPIRESARQNLIGAQARLLADNVQLTVLNNALNSLDQDMATQPDKLRKLSDLKNDATVYQKIFDDLQIELVQLNSRRTGELGYAQMLQYPSLPKAPKAPNPPLYTIAAGVFGLLIGGIVIFLIDNYDPTVRDGLDILQIVDLPILAHLPVYERRKLSKKENQVLTQSYQRLASVLSYSGLGNKTRTLMLTSTSSNEGSSNVARGLATVLNAAGRTVRLIDLNGIVPKLVPLDNDLRLEQLTAPQSQTDITIKPATDIAVDVSSLFHPSQSTFLIEQLKASADIIIFDAPSVYEGVNSGALAEYVDGILFVSKVETISREEVRQALDLILRSSAPILGVVINDSHQKI
jgi:uncharacterized protein involved in exopolysaccharide biosynthesis/Mrp family chromosome partitioning ATPase